MTEHDLFEARERAVRSYYATPNEKDPGKIFDAAVELFKAEVSRLTASNEKHYRLWQEAQERASFHYAFYLSAEVKLAAKRKVYDALRTLIDEQGGIIPFPLRDRLKAVLESGDELATPPTPAR